MEVTSTPANGIFSIQVLIVLGITVALVSAVAVILYNKIQQQGDKLSAVMELSAVLAQEVRSHDTVLKNLHSRGNSLRSDNIPSNSSHISSGPSHPANIVLNSSDNDVRRVHVSDGSGSSSDEDSDEDSDDEIQLNISPSISTTLDNMLMNPMCIVPDSQTRIDTDSDSDETDIDESDSDESDSDESGDDPCETLSVLSSHLGSVIELDDDVVEVVELNIHSSSLSDKRVITLSDISIEVSNGEIETDVHKVVVDSGDNVLDYKKLSVNELRRLAVERKLLDKGVKMKKGELVELLTNV